MSKKKKWLIGIFAGLYLLMQIVGFIFVFSLQDNLRGVGWRVRNIDDRVYFMFDEGYRDYDHGYFSGFFDDYHYASDTIIQSTRVSWSKLDPETMQARCKLTIMPSYTHENGKAFLSYDGMRHEMKWDKKKESFTVQLTLPLDESSEEVIFVYQVGNVTRRENLNASNDYRNPLCLYQLPTDSGFHSQPFKQKINAMEIANNRAKITGSIELTADEPLPFGGVFESGRVVAIESYVEPNKILYSAQLDQNGAVALDFTAAPYVNFRLQLELDSEDGMVYIYPFHNVGWEYGRYDDDRYFYAYENTGLVARFPDGEEMNLRAQSNYY